MTSPPTGEHLWIVGAGRMGLALGDLLHRSGAVASLTVSGRRPDSPEHPLFGRAFPPVRYQPDLSLPSPPPTAIVLAVPDAAIEEIARHLATAALPSGTPVLHLSGALGVEALEPLARGGCAVGSLHPLAAVPDSTDGAERLRGAWYGVEGQGAARTLAERIVRAAGGHLLPVRPDGKLLYHAAAVFAANYLVVLFAVAERLMERAGVPTEAAHNALGELARGALANVAERGAAAALTGPVARGDAETVRLHLARLSGEERRLYSVLAREALALVRERGQHPELAERVAHVLEEGT